MGRPFNPKDKEYMKMAMLKHEETFKEQLYELHRLYQIQKILMKKIAKSSSNQKHDQDNSDTRNHNIIVSKANQTTTINNDHHHHPADVQKRPRPQHAPDLQLLHHVEDESDQLELTLGLGPSSNNSRRRSGRTVLRDEISNIPNSESAASFSSASTGSSNMKRANSGLIHQRTNAILMRGDDRFIGRKWGLELLPAGPSPSLLGARKTSTSEMEEQLMIRQDSHSSNPAPWLLQALSLNTG